MSATVYASQGGHRYHATRACHGLGAGQGLWDWDSPDDWPNRAPYNGGYAVHGVTTADAFAAGKEPCAVCFPGLRPALYRGNSEHDFGHEPVLIDGDLFCARCRSHGIDEDGDPWSYPTLWPCASAVVLGLVPQGEEADR